MEESKDLNFQAAFAKIKERLILTNDQAYQKYGRRFGYFGESVKRNYTPEEIVRILDSGSLVEKQQLSRYYFMTNGFYRSILLYHANLLKYAGILIPNPSFGKKLSSNYVNKRYYQALDTVEAMHIPVILADIATHALVEGSYYGIIITDDKDKFALMNLPFGYCRTRFKDIYGNDVIEFNVSYFNTIVDEADRRAALKLYPKVVRNAYNAYKNGDYDKIWVIIPSDMSVCIPFFDGVPTFLGLIPATLQYDEAIQSNQDMNAEEIKKIIVQQIPHLSDGRLLFEPEEALEIHEGTVGMMKGNPNVSVLTTYADVDSIQSEGRSDASRRNDISQSLDNIYSSAGVSREIFSSTTATAVKFSYSKDLALMMNYANKCSVFITNYLNFHYANSNVSFKYTILPISHFNAEDYTKASLSLANSGYSFILPALGLGLTQRDLNNIKDLENDVLKLSEKLIPLATSYTQSGKNGTNPEGGRPALPDEDKAEQTAKNEESSGGANEGGSE